MAIYKMKSGSYKAQVYVDGQMFYKTFKKRSDAKAYELEMLSSGGTYIQQIQDRKSATLERFLKDEYLTYLLNEKTHNTYTNYKNRIDTWVLKSRLSYKKIGEIDYLLLKKHVNGMLRKGASVNTVNYVIKVLDSAFKYAMKTGYLITNPMIQISKLKDNRDLTNVNDKSLSLDEARELLKRIEGHQYFPFTLILTMAGLRISEACALRVKSVDFKKNKIIIDKKLEAYYPRIEHGEPEVEKALLLSTPKSQKSIRTIPVKDELLNVLKPLCENKQDNDFIFVPKRRREFGINSNMYNVITRRGNTPAIQQAFCYNPSNMIKYMSDMFSAVGFPKMTSHKMRHTFARLWMEKIGDLFGLQKMLGHSSQQATQIYADIGEDHLEKKALKMESLL